MEQLGQSLLGLGDFAMYFGASLILVVIFKYVYAMVTPYDDWGLVKENNLAAGSALAGSIIGFSIALSGAASNSVSIVDFLVWAVVALIAQVLAYLMVRLFLPKIAERIQNGETPAGVVLGAVSIAIGLLNSACMTF